MLFFSPLSLLLCMYLFFFCNAINIRLPVTVECRENMFIVLPCEGLKCAPSFQVVLGIGTRENSAPSCSCRVSGVTPFSCHP